MLTMGQEMTRIKSMGKQYIHCRARCVRFQLASRNSDDVYVVDVRSKIGQCQQFRDSKKGEKTQRESYDMTSDADGIYCNTRKRESKRQCREPPKEDTDVTAHSGGAHAV